MVNMLNITPSKRVTVRLLALLANHQHLCKRDLADVFLSRLQLQLLVQEMNGIVYHTAHHSETSLEILKQ